MMSLPSPSPFLPVTAPLPSPSTNNTTLTVAAVTLASLLAVAFLFLTYYAVLLRHRPPPRPSPSPPPSPPHHAWLTRTVGLDESLIRSIPAVPFSSSEDDPPTDCAVCLSDLSHGDLVRFLPRCRHAFHVPCVDTWLRSHVSCPLCRSPVLLPDPDADVGSSPDCCFDGNGEGATTDRHRQPIGPSASMDSRTAVIVVETHPSSKESSSEAVNRERKDEAEEEEGEVESPQSGSGGGFFSRLRNGRSSSSVLPL